MKYFFTHVTDFSGYDGAFTPGHLWFILFLFVISVASLFFFHFLPYGRAEGFVEHIPALGILLLFVPIWLAYYLGNFGGYSIGKNLSLYLAGYYVLSNDTVLGRMEQSIKWIAGLCIMGNIVSAILYYCFSYYGDLWENYIGWNTILVLQVSAVCVGSFMLTILAYHLVKKVSIVRELAGVQKSAI